jgi:tetratricopeptide (TPR) repeat protein
LAGGFIILFAAGVFDKPNSVTTNKAVTQNQNSGIDLSAVQKINELEAAVKANPENNEALLELAHLRNDSGMFEKAIENYKEYLSRVPADADARIDMGVCYYNLGRYNEAIDAMKKLLNIAPIIRLDI